MPFYAYKSEFDPSQHKPTASQVWVHLYNPPSKFWDKKILTNIARGIGIPLRFDKPTIDGNLAVTLEFWWTSI